MAHPGQLTIERTEVEIPSGDVRLSGDLVVPAGAPAVVVIVGAPALRMAMTWDAMLGRLAGDLQDARLATLLLNLRTPGEVRTLVAELPHRPPGEEAELLTRRLMDVLEWLGGHAATSRLTVGLLAAGGGAAAPALCAAAATPRRVGAITCYNGRLEAMPCEPVRVSTPTLLVVDAEEPGLVEANRALAKEGLAPVELQVLPARGRSEEDRLQQRLWLAVDWFERHLVGRSP